MTSGVFGFRGFIPIVRTLCCWARVSAFQHVGFFWLWRIGRAARLVTVKLINHADDVRYFPGLASYAKLWLRGWNRTNSSLVGANGRTGSPTRIAPWMRRLPQPMVGLPTCRKTTSCRGCSCSIGNGQRRAADAPRCRHHPGWPSLPASPALGQAKPVLASGRVE